MVAETPKIGYSTHMRTLTKETPQHIGKNVVLMGWVHSRRDHGKLIFIDLRDRWGIVQVVFTPGNKELLVGADRLRSEWVIKLEGKVKERPKGMENLDMPTGGIEIEATELEIISEAQTPPFALDTDGYEIGEDGRLKYRYLDLRRERLHKNLILRDSIVSFIRSFLHTRDFIEIETPIITKSTPEGARDYVVPSRLYGGKFYALPQSPQQYKQLLMVAGFERYFQIARCFRDEDTRGDRQPEFTQLDIEMSFITQEEILSLVEELYLSLTKELLPDHHVSEIPFPRLTHKESMERYGSDKPDLRKDEKDPRELAYAFVVDFPMFEWNEKEKRWDSAHHPFTMMKDEDLGFLAKGELGRIRANSYDFVLNGCELASGSIRIHDPLVQQTVFKHLGLTGEEIQDKFGHMIEAFSYGAPPHGGIAPGIDRFVMVVTGEPNIREVIAFPKTGDARDLMMDAPAPLSSGQLKDLHLRVSEE